jgi:hypothetical protein
MATYLESLLLDELSSDPGSPAEGQVWYNTTTDQLKMYEGGTTRVIADSRHTDSTSNPHSVDLEQARTDGNVLAGDIDMNNAGKITNLSAPTLDGDATNKKYVDDEIVSVQQGLDWQESVLDKDLVTAPGSPTEGDRYIIAGIGGAWSTGTINDIAEWNGTAWEFATPNEGFTTRVEDEDKVYIHDGSSWGTWDATVDHGNLLGLGDDDHSHYHNNTRGDARYFQETEHINTSAGAGDAGKPIKLDAGGLIDGTMIDDSDIDHVNIANKGTNAHSVIDTHLGSTANPHSVTATQVGKDTAQWNADELQGESVDAASPNTNDHLIYDGAKWAPTAQSPIANAKAGSVLAASFTGSPKTFAVVFNTAYGSNDYSVSVTQVGSSGNARVLTVSSKSATGFTIELNTASVSGLTSVEWASAPHSDA